MVLVNPWWLVAPVAAILLAAILLLWQSRRRQAVEFTAIHWLRPARRPRRMFATQIPLWMILVAGSAIASALGTLHFDYSPPGRSRGVLHVHISIRYLRGRCYGYIRIDGRSNPPPISIRGMGKPITFSAAQLLHGTVFSVPDGVHVSLIKLQSQGKTIWQSHVPLLSRHPVVNVTLGQHVPHEVLHIIKIIPWVKVTGRGSPDVELFIGSQWRRHIKGSELIFMAHTAQSLVGAARPVAMGADWPVLRFVSFSHVRVSRVRAMRLRPPWQTIVTVGGQPWIKQRQRLNTYDWVVGSGLAAHSTNWPKIDSFVIFVTNALRLAGHISATPSLWTANATIGRRSAKAVSLIEVDWLFGLLAGVLAVGGLWNLLSRQSMPTHPRS
jgi:hypothetical protein